MSTKASAKNYFKTQGYIPGGILINANHEELALDTLPAILRVLLTTDGTVTKSLEAYFWEPIRVENLGQAPVALQGEIKWLQAAAGETVLQRRVRLTGGESGDVYVYAESIVRLQLLPEPLREDILAGRIGIGELLRECGLETYREILDVGGAAEPEVHALFGEERKTRVIYRTYRILLNHQPAILITEKFPERLYAEKR